VQDTEDNGIGKG